MYYNTRNEDIFNGGRLYDYLEEHKAQIKASIGKMSAEEIAANSDADIIKHYIAKHSIEPLTLYEEEKTVDPSEIKIDVSQNPWRNPFGDSECYADGVLLTLTIPYVGDSHLWKLEPATFTCSLMSRVKKIMVDEGGVSGELQIKLQYCQDSARDEQIRSDVNSEVGTIKSNISAQNTQLAQYHRELEKFVTDCLSQRKNRLAQQNKLLKNLNIPIRKKNGVPDIARIQVKRRISPVNLKKAAPGSVEPWIDEVTYSDILAIMRFMGRTFEETPATFSKLEEEDLRNVFLAALNGYFEGDAAGETFRKSGKTDICIKEKEKAAFVAECKIWHGKKSLQGALDQLLGYLTWRDCKASIVIFNKDTADFSKVREGVPAAIKNHPMFVKELQHGEVREGEWRFVIKHENDSQCEVVLHIFAFDVQDKKLLVS